MKLAHLALALLAVASPVLADRSASPAAAPIKPRLTSDKQPLPDASPRVAIIKIPVIGTHLDALPEDVCDKVWALDSELDYVTETRNHMNEAGIDLTGFNYVGNAGGGFTRTVMDVENGRVRRLILFNRNLSASLADTTLRKIASNTQERVKRGKNAEDFVFRVKGVHFYERLVGHWSHDTADERHPNMNGGVNIVPGTHQEGPCGIEVGITDEDWAILNVCTDPKMLKAVQEQRLVIGMRPVEAYLAMKTHRLYRQYAPGAITWTWTDTTVDLQGYSDVSDNFGSFRVVHFVNSEHPIARVAFKDGLVAKIEDETELLAPPKN
ncbi:MAG: hypothetical protein ACTHLZ_19835 [Tepidisphaeraceae bacterium]